MASRNLFLNHSKAQCGVYEIGKRIHSLLDSSLGLRYSEVEGTDVSGYLQLVEENQPDYIVYNFYPETMKFVSPETLSKFPKTKHLAIIHDPLDPQFVSYVSELFDAWIIHDHTNTLPSYNKFTTFRPIPRYERKAQQGKLSIGSHGFNVSPWKMFDRIISLAQDEFDEIEINLNITTATFGPEGQLSPLQSWVDSIYKKDVQLNITTDYLETELDVVDFLSRNTLNVYFYNPPGPHVGVGGSADLAVSSQSSLVVNSAYMYRHFHDTLGYFEEKGSFFDFLDNRDLVQKLYEEWSPEAISRDYRTMIESVL